MLPKNAASGPVAAEVEQRSRLATVETIDGIVKTRVRINIVAEWQWIVDVFRPAFFFKNRENYLLITRRNSEMLDRHSRQR